MARDNNFSELACWYGNNWFSQLHSNEQFHELLLDIRFIRIFNVAIPGNYQYEIS